ncbi:TIGR02594 family protein [Chenggangzhangella methanolivorans]|uniref:TIGR02594 family protein n=1 Tax=Chenggangzhangella methanolivorans TaxID=1437009 RepID=A0A9E6R832_9HYPH|nr:TIGR02594 family protein [Chenggangzhangella methanolivorans]QZN99559.1 TIGR02594 family protein [Chenggangzhangella methanolivorans]
MNVLAIQQRLKALGFDPGALDGIWGRQTMAAVKRFQTAHGLHVDGIVGQATTAALNAAAVQGGPGKAVPPILEQGQVDPVWLVEARRWMGLREIVGAASNPKILEWGKAAADWFVNDDIPWCGAFVFGQFAAVLPDEKLPTNPLWARGWAVFGRGLSKPSPGAVLVFERGPNAGHVGFYVGEDKTRYRVLGGNQSNAVTETWIEKKRLLAIRWPSTVALPVPQTVVVKGGGPTSTNEA